MEAAGDARARLHPRERAQPARSEQPHGAASFNPRVRIPRPRILRWVIRTNQKRSASRSAEIGRSDFDLVLSSRLYLREFSFDRGVIGSNGHDLYRSVVSNRNLYFFR